MALPWGAPLTYDDLQEMPDDGHRYELVDGSLLVTPAPGYPHQFSSMELSVLLHRSIGPDLVVLAAPFDYVVSPHTVLQPDLLVARRADVSTRGLVGAAPLLAVEIVSPSTRLTDLGTKRLAYQAAGVPAYWVVDPAAPSLTVYRLREGKYAEEARVVGEAAYRTDWPAAIEVVPARLGPPPGP